MSEGVLFFFYIFCRLTFGFGCPLSFILVITTPPAYPHFGQNITAPPLYRVGSNNLGQVKKIFSYASVRYKRKVILMSNNVITLVKKSL